MSSICITGGTGLVGTALQDLLILNKHKLSILSRTCSNVPQNIECHIVDWRKNRLASSALSDIDYIIHLAGANVASGRWTSAQKKRILDSRIKSAQLLLEKIKMQAKLPKAYIVASAIGYYGQKTTKKIYTEMDKSGDGFLADTCRQIEQIADSFEALGIRTVKIRTGVVLSPKGGALAKMIVPIKLGIGSALGSGQQYIPWIHIDDLCQIYLKAIEEEQMQGSINAVAPEHVTNRVFMESIAKTINKPFFMPPVPAGLLRIMVGEMSSMLLNGSRVSSEKIAGLGYVFRFPKLQGALQNLLS